MIFIVVWAIVVFVVVLLARRVAQCGHPIVGVLLMTAAGLSLVVWIFYVAMVTLPDVLTGAVMTA